MPTAQKRWGGTIFSYFSLKGADCEVFRFASVVWKDLGSATHLLTALNLFLITINYKYFCCYCQLLLLHLPLLLHCLLQIGSDSNSLCYVLWYDGKSHEAGASPTFPDERRGPRVMSRELPGSAICNALLDSRRWRPAPAPLGKS